jgi:hypothetical protein
MKFQQRQTFLFFFPIFLKEKDFSAKESRETASSRLFLSLSCSQLEKCSPIERNDSRVRRAFFSFLFISFRVFYVL